MSRIDKALLSASVFLLLAGGVSQWAHATEPTPANGGPVPGAVATPSPEAETAVPAPDQQAQVPQSQQPGESAAAGEAYLSPERPMCMRELQKDASWRSDLKKQVRATMHTEEAELMLANNRHVVMAYVAFWGLSVVFIMLMWLRQRKLSDQIAQLQREVAHAAK